MTRPDYYDSFTCIAGDCPFTCCQEWEIAVDEDTYKQWKEQEVPQRYLDRTSGEAGKKLSEYVKDGESGRAISLCSNGHCPFFNKTGLCDIVLDYGEEAISNTCHTFPREEHEYYSATEQTLAIGCPAVIDLLWKCDEFRFIDEKKDVNAEESILFYLRDSFIRLIGNKRYPLPILMKMIFFIISDLLDRYDEDEDTEFLTREYIDSYTRERYLDKLAERLSVVVPDHEDNIVEQNELLLDIADNYQKKGIYRRVLDPILAVAKDYEEESNYEAFSSLRWEFEPLWNSMEDKLRLLVAEEIYSTMFMRDGDLYSMAIKMQWIGLTFAVLKQMVFIAWTLNDNKKLPYEQIREIICVLIRMTGYSEEDIEEYLQDCFVNIIWDWGYMNLIL